MSRATEIYEQHIKSLPPQERLQLLAMVARDLADEPNERPRRSIMELHGLGKELWDGIDAQAYVDQLRDEWNRQRS